MFAITNGWHPHFAALDELRSAQRAFLRGLPQGAGPAREGAVLSDQGEAFVLDADVPGADLDSVKLDVTGKGFVLSVQTAAPALDGKNVLRRERTGLALSHKLEFPVAIEPEKVTATLRHGTLRIVFPKAPVSGPKRITVTA